jgi:hypothetical protein
MRSSILINIRGNVGRLRVWVRRLLGRVLLSSLILTIMATAQSPMNQDGAHQPQENWPTAVAQAAQNGGSDSSLVSGAPPAPPTDEGGSPAKERDYSYPAGNGDAEKGDYRGEKQPKVLSSLLPHCLSLFVPAGRPSRASCPCCPTASSYRFVWR